MGVVTPCNVVLGGAGAQAYPRQDDKAGKYHGSESGDPWYEEASWPLAVGAGNMAMNHSTRDYACPRSMVTFHMHGKISNGRGNLHHTAHTHRSGPDLTYLLYWAALGEIM